MFYPKSVVEPNTINQFIQPFYSTGVGEQCLPDIKFESREWNFRFLCILGDYFGSSFEVEKIEGEWAVLFGSFEI